MGGKKNKKNFSRLDDNKYAQLNIQKIPQKKDPSVPGTKTDEQVPVTDARKQAFEGEATGKNEHFPAVPSSTDTFDNLDKSVMPTGKNPNDSVLETEERKISSDRRREKDDGRQYNTKTFHNQERRDNSRRNNDDRSRNNNPRRTNQNDSNEYRENNKPNRYYNNQSYNNEFPDTPKRNNRKYNEYRQNDSRDENRYNSRGRGTESNSNRRDQGYYSNRGPNNPSATHEGGGKPKNYDEISNQDSQKHTNWDSWGQNKHKTNEPSNQDAQKHTSWGQDKHKTNEPSNQDAQKHTIWGRDKHKTNEPSNQDAQKHTNCWGQDKPKTNEPMEDWDEEVSNSGKWDVANVSANPVPDVNNASFGQRTSTVKVVPISPGSSSLNPHADSFHMSPANANKSWNENIIMEEEASLNAEEEEKLRLAPITQSCVIRDNQKIEKQNEWSDDENKKRHHKIDSSNRQNQSGGLKRNLLHSDPSGLPDSDLENLSLQASSKQSSTNDRYKSDQRNKSRNSGASYRDSLDKSKNSELDETQSDWSSAWDSSSNNRKNDSGSKWKNNRKSYGTSEQDSSYEARRTSTGPRSRDLSVGRYVDFEDEDKKEYETWKFNPEASKISEVEKDLFTVEDEFALAHCVAEDLSMGSGIAVEFKRTFKRTEELMAQRKKQGQVAILEIDGRFIYYLVTKRVSTGKPTYSSLWKSLTELRTHMEKNKVKKLAIPRIGCGLDRLDWNKVKMLLEFLFRKADVVVMVCNFQQEEASPSLTRKSLRRCKIVYPDYPITKIESHTIILYFASRDGKETQTMKDLNEKFKHLAAFKNERKCLGDAIRFEDSRQNYILYGCIVKELMNDSFDFVNFHKCLGVIQKHNKKDILGYVGFQRAYDDDDDLLNDKILNLMRDSLRDVEIYCCDNVYPATAVKE